jgi:hypothetical protein
MHMLHYCASFQVQGGRSVRYWVLAMLPVHILHSIILISFYILHSAYPTSLYIMHYTLYIIHYTLYMCICLVLYAAAGDARVPRIHYSLRGNSDDPQRICIVAVVKIAEWRFPGRTPMIRPVLLNRAIAFPQTHLFPPIAARRVRARVRARAKLRLRLRLCLTPARVCHTQ